MRAACRTRSDAPLRTAHSGFAQRLRTAAFGYPQLFWLREGTLGAAKMQRKQQIATPHRVGMGHAEPGQVMPPLSASR